MAPRYVKVPNLVVDVNSWTRLACYPRSSFCPLSFRRPISYGRITNFCFRNCSSCRSCSKAGLCVCTFIPISIRDKPTFVNASVTFWANIVNLICIALTAKRIFQSFAATLLLHRLKYKFGILLFVFANLFECENFYRALAVAVPS